MLSNVHCILGFFFFLVVEKFLNVSNVDLTPKYLDLLLVSTSDSARALQSSAMTCYVCPFFVSVEDKQVVVNRFKGSRCHLRLYSRF